MSKRRELTEKLQARTALVEKAEALLSDGRREEYQAEMDKVKAMNVEIRDLQDLIAEQFAIDADEITMDSSFVDDLGADSVDLVELVMAMEEEFDIGEIEEEDLTGLKTVGDCVKYLTNKINN